MRAAYDVAAVRTAEGILQAAVPDGALMQRAASGLARRCAEMLGRVYGSRVVLLVGSGDNGGDALFAGARLAVRGARVDAIQTGDRMHAAGRAALEQAGGLLHDPAAAGELIGRADLVMDGMVGIGARGKLRPPAEWLAGLASSGRAPVVAVDVPSGVDATTGRVEGAVVRADVTVTFGSLKPGLLVAPGAQAAGAVDLVDIGLAGYLREPPAVRVLDAEDVARLLPVPGADGDKYRRGVLGVVAGSDTYPGAAVLAVGAALHAGAGMIRYVGAAAPAELVRQRWPEAVCTVVDHDASGSPDDPEAVLEAGRVQAWVIGPGLGTGDGARSVLKAVLSTDLPVLVDADALNLLAAHPFWVARRRGPTLLTPHAGEFARLTGAERADVAADRLDHARRAAADLAATVLLKGSTTVVCDPAGATYVNPTGTGYLATAGSGDVLSGAAGALLAQGLQPLEAGAVGAYLHGLAARLAAGPGGGAPIRAFDVIRYWRSAVATVRG
ncbi:MAG TPA: NAD(P)H-hydrate dehydratase [Mycobacteriales bacterium]|nr:NAD(P)H-hydrate dehydratase [Mycobacteriales bacterium]